jgi:hypothetical protein
MLLYLPLFRFSEFIEKLVRICLRVGDKVGRITKVLRKSDGITSRSFSLFRRVNLRLLWTLDLGFFWSRSLRSGVASASFLATHWVNFHLSIGSGIGGRLSFRRRWLGSSVGGAWRSWSDGDDSRRCFHIFCYGLLNIGPRGGGRWVPAKSEGEI